LIHLMHRYHLYNYLPSEQMGCAHSNQAPGPGKCDRLKELQALAGLVQLEEEKAVRGPNKYL